MMNLPKMPYPQRDAAYYQRFHEQDPGYQTNNWLLEELESVQAFGAKSILELACGNGRFLECAAPLYEHVYGCDWATSPRIPGVLSRHPNASFFLVDLYHDLPPCRAELVVSADFLEHLAPDALPDILRRIDTLSTQAFHKVACYDDGHSHLSILSPGRWLELFRAIDPAYCLERVEPRLGDTWREIAVFTKGRPGPIPLREDQVMWLAECHLREGRPREAEPVIAQGLARYPQSPRLHVASANLGPVQGHGGPASDVDLSVVRLHYGCGDIRRAGFVGIDIRPCAGADLLFPPWEAGPFEEGTVDEIYSRHMLEHLDPADAIRTLSRWHALLKPRGRLRLIVPDLRFHALQLLGQAHSWDEEPRRNLEHAMAGFYGWRDPSRGGSELDSHRWGYTWESLSQLLSRSGFTEINRVECGEDSEPWHLHFLAKNGAR